MHDSTEMMFSKKDKSIVIEDLSVFAKSQGSDESTKQLTRKSPGDMELYCILVVLIYFPVLLYPLWFQGSATLV